ncbi:hypothetical protein DSO57_1010566 [Entomophthora muscae]|uniref:Uncharacterized protein n=1 Tax=Entomophthora muscae TaxID=34485 RepID=A0ACC2THR1_9FUNG|nr:hypothetical protein DSO57_1010566 [Entomophthora muscae]
MSNDPSGLLLFPGDLLTSGEAIAKSLTCDILDFHSAKSTLPASSAKGPPLSPPLMKNDTYSVPLQETEVLPLAPSCALWLVASFVIRNAPLVNPDNNLFLGLVKERFPPLVAIRSPKMIGLISSKCSFLPEENGSNWSADPGFSATGFEPRSSLDPVASDLVRFSVNSALNQSLPFACDSSQSKFDKLVSKHCIFIPSDVGNNVVSPCLIPGLLSPVSSCANTPGPHLSCEEQLSS